MVAEVFVVYQVPLATGILIRPSVTLTREVDPLGMTELVTHEIQITTVDGTSGHQTNHLVQGDASLCHIIDILLREMPIHIGINETEDDGLIAYQRLIVTLAVRNGLLVGTTVLHFPEDAAHIDILIAHLLDGLDPIVGDIHRHTVVEAIAAILELRSQARHARHLLSNRDGVGVYLVDEFVGQRQVTDSVIILMTIEIIAIATEGLAQSVTIVEHRGDTIETETVEVELLKPVLTVRQEEMDHLVLAIIETEGVPCRMLMTVARIEELVGVACQIAKTLHLILHGMRVNDIHDHSNAVLVGGINEFLQFVGCTETAGGSEERAHMVTKRAVVRMLLYGHHLNAVITILDDAWQHIVLELRIGAYLLGILTHSHMALIDEQRRLVGLELLLAENIRFLRVPYLGRENLRVIVLNHTTAPSRDTLTFATIPLHLHLIQVAMLDSLLAELQLPVASSGDTLALIFVVFLPVVEITNKIDFRRIGSPLAEHPSLRQFVKTEIEMSRCKLRERLLTILRQLTDFPEGMVMTSSDGSFIRLKPGIILYQSDMLRLFFHLLRCRFFSCCHICLEFDD